MPAKFRAAASSPSDSITVPAAIPAGDLLFLFFSKFGGTYGDPAADGFTQLNTSAVTKLYWKIATAADVGATFSGYGAKWMMLAAYYDILGSDPIDAVSPDANKSSSSTFSTPSIIASKAGMRVVDFVRASMGSDTGITTYPATMRAKEDGYTYDASIITDFEAAAAGATPQRAYGSFNAPAWDAVVVSINGNAAPNAPILTTPVGATINRDVTNRFDWDFSDPDAGDSQSKYDLRYRIRGVGAAWTTVTSGVPNTFWDAAAGLFAAGDYEWQVRTYDAQGVVGPYSTSAFFTAASPPPGPTLIEPVSGSIVSNTHTAEWSTAEQDAYQIRRVADSAGSADTTTVYYDSGEVSSATARAHALTFETNGRFEHVQLRTKYGGLWSPWSSSRVEVSYTPPPDPSLVVALADDIGGNTVTITNPTPGTGEPSVAYNNVFVRTAETSPVTDSDRPYSETGTRIAFQKPLNSVLIDYIPAGDVVYEYRVEAVATNDTTAFSAWTAVDPIAEPTIYYGGSY